MFRVPRLLYITVCGCVQGTTPPIYNCMWCVQGTTPPIYNCMWCVQGTTPPVYNCSGCVQGTTPSVYNCMWVCSGYHASSAPEDFLKKKYKSEYLSKSEDVVFHKQLDSHKKQVVQPSPVRSTFSTLFNLLHSTVCSTFYSPFNYVLFSSVADPYPVGSGLLDFPDPDPFFR